MKKSGMKTARARRQAIDKLFKVGELGLQRMDLAAQEIESRLQFVESFVNRALDQEDRLLATWRRLARSGAQPQRRIARELLRERRVRFEDLR